MIREMNSAKHIALETYQRSLDAIANKETEGAEFGVWWDPVSRIAARRNGWTADVEAGDY